MLSQRWNHRHRQSNDIRPLPMEPNSRGKRLRDGTYDDRSEVTSREKRHRWLERHDTHRQWIEPTRARRVYLSPFRDSSHHHQQQRHSRRPPRYCDGSPPSQQYNRPGLDRTPPASCDRSPSQLNESSRVCSPRNLRDKQHPSCSSDSRYVRNSPRYGGRDRHYATFSRYPHPCNPYDRHWRSRRPSPWRRAPPYFREAQRRRRGRTGGNQHGGWGHEKQYYLKHHKSILCDDGYISRSRSQLCKPLRHSPVYRHRITHFKQSEFSHGRYDHQNSEYKCHSGNDNRRYFQPLWERKKRWKGEMDPDKDEDEERRPRSFNEINSSKKQKGTKHDEDIVHFEWLPGMKLSKRFVVISQLGEGTFGRVVECEDLQTGKRVAIKVVRDISRYTTAAQIEAEILEEVREKDVEMQSNCIMLIERFLYDRRRGRERRSSSIRRCHHRRRRAGSNRYDSERSSTNKDRQITTDESTTRSSTDENCYGEGIHMCLVSEKLGPSLFAFLSQNQYRGFFIEDIQTISMEVLKALAFLHHIKLTHTDLKPENILFVDGALDRVLFPRSRYPTRYWDGDASDISDEEIEGFHSATVDVSHVKPVYTNRPCDCRVKLIDFGSATFEDDSHCSLINTRQYRAPEVILQIGWSTSSDVWCLGSILMELYTGVLLFRTHEHLEHLALIERIVDPIPQSILHSASNTDGAKYLSKNRDGGRLSLDWPYGASSQKSIDRVSNSRPLENMVLPCHRLFAEFVRYLLQVDPARRPTPSEALQHPFLRTRLPEC